MVYEESSSVAQEVIEEEVSMSQESAALQQQQQLQLQQQQQQQQMEAEMQMAKMSMSDEEFKQHQKMKRLEAEAKEEVRQTLNAQREAKMKAMRDAQPQKPKEITVIAGDDKQVRIQLGGEQKDQADNRKQVAEAAGLKHVPLPDFDDSDNSAWAGSLKKTAKTKMLTGRAEEENDENPWAGSLRHVKDNLAEVTRVMRRKICTVELHGWEHSDMLSMTTRSQRTMESISNRARDTQMRMQAIPMNLLVEATPSPPSP